MTTIAARLTIAEREAMRRAARTGKGKHHDDLEVVSLDELLEAEADDRDDDE